ncbi:MAG: DUF1501 domain-containing protein [Planctomycetota bacterium]|nr:DUF1501 domain-containing protein [Planctomycetota bacterium]MDA1249761.1 DUF1501 domain-containing protein [Planctomycetota bacterium]
MLNILDTGTQLCDGLTRRQLMQVGSLTLGGLSLPQLLQARDLAQPLPVSDKSFGAAKNVIFLYLAGGPPQHETFDPKPDAPDGIRGPFKPISTNVPGIQFCELLPRTAAMSDKLAICRSMATDDNIHSSSGAWVLTGYKYRGPNARTIQPTDWPYLGSVVKQLKPGEKLPALTSVWLPDIMRLNENVTPSGQTAGFLGTQWNPEVFVGDPAEPTYEIESLRKTDITPIQLSRRQSLLSQLENRFRRIDGAVTAYDSYQQQAFDLLTSGTARQAFDVSQESDKVRDRYGRNRWGQCVLLARRLVEAGVRLVHVQWPREPGDNASDNPLWDTHAQNADRVEDVLCPMFDVGYTALLEDLDQRGLLDETLVVAIGEFGRTPKINGNGGRDHWGSVFSFALAGAGIGGGQVYGSSDKNGGYPENNRVQPGDLTATLFHLLGIPHQGHFIDAQNRPHRLTGGEPIWQLLGSEPATTERVASTGDVARVPKFDPTRYLLQTDFAGEEPIKSIAEPSRPKGWRADPLHSAPGENDFGTTVLRDLDTPTAALGFNFGDGAALTVAQNAKTYLAQEVRSPYPGSYVFRVKLRAEASSPEFFSDVFSKHFSCRLVFFRFNAQTKRVNESAELGSTTFEVKLVESGSDEWQTVELSKQFLNPNPGANFSFGAGMGVSIQLVKSSGGTLSIAAGDRAFVRISDVQLKFLGKEVNDKVTV